MAPKTKEKRYFGQSGKEVSKEQFNREGEELKKKYLGSDRDSDRESSNRSSRSRDSRSSSSRTSRGTTERKPIYLNKGEGGPEDDGKPRGPLGGIFDFARIREQDNVIGKLVKAATDWKTTIALAATAATVGAAGAYVAASRAAATAARTATAAGSRAVITGTVSAHRLGVTSQGAEKLFGLGVRSATRNFIGRPAASGVHKLFGPARFASNLKTKWASTSLMTKIGFGLGGAFMINEFAGTYPFAEFELAEATDKIGIAIFKATEAGNLAEADDLQIYLDEMLDTNLWEKVISTIPYLNIAQNVRKNIAAAERSAAAFQALTDKRQSEISGEVESDFEAQRRESDEASSARRLKDLQFEAEYFRLIREKKFDESQTLLDSQ